MGRAGTFALQFIQAVAVTRLIENYVVSVNCCYGPSMMPTFHPRKYGTWCLVDQTWHVTGFNKGEVVLARSPVEPGKILCKRVIAMEGETVNAPPRWHSGRGCHTEQLVRVPPGHVWLSGDNLAMSVDSRDYGPVPYQLLIGRPTFKVWPWEDVGFVEHCIPDHVQVAYRMNARTVHA